MPGRRERPRLHLLHHRWGAPHCPHPLSNLLCARVSASRMHISNAQLQWGSWPIWPLSQALPIATQLVTVPDRSAPSRSFDPVFCFALSSHSTPPLPPAVATSTAARLASTRQRGRGIPGWRRFARQRAPNPTADPPRRCRWRCERRRRRTAVVCVQLWCASNSAFVVRLRAHGFVLGEICAVLTALAGNIYAVADLTAMRTAVRATRWLHTHVSKKRKTKAMMKKRRKMKTKEKQNTTNLIFTKSQTHTHSHTGLELRVCRRGASRGGPACHRSID